MKSLMVAIAMVFCILIPRYAQSQVHESWVSRYDGSGLRHDEISNDMAVDSTGNIYICGFADIDSFPWRVILIVKYNPSGELIWARHFADSNYSIAFGNFITLGRSNDLYVAGILRTDGSDQDFVLLKYNLDGILQWVSTYPNFASGETSVNGLVLDSAGNIYICGVAPIEEYSTKFKFITLKYNSDGQMLWESFFENSQSVLMQIGAMTIDPEGNIYLAAYYNIVSGGATTSLVLKYNSSGEEQWAAHYANPGGYNNQLYQIALDTSGYVYVSGTLSVGTQTPFQIIKYSNDGIREWVEVYDPNQNPEEDALCGPAAMAIGSLGDIYLTGAANRDYISYFVTVKYNPQGIRQWSTFYEGLPSTSASATSLVLDNLDNIYITGYSRGWTNSHYDYTTIKYDSSGDEIWLQLLGGFEHGFDAPYVIALDNQNNVIVSGQSLDSNLICSDILTVKYVQEGDGIKEQDTPSLFTLADAYPNPFNAQTTIRYSLTREAPVFIRIYDILGNEICEMAEGIRSAGEYLTRWDAHNEASGIYFYKIQAGDFAEIGKMTLLK